LNTTPIPLAGLFAKADLRRRMSQDVDLIFNFSLPAPETNMSSFGVGLRIKRMEFRLDLINGQLGQGYGSVQYGQ
jgi:hypothetical protein